MTLTQDRRIHIVQGEYKVESDSAIALTTILGSCVAACLWDPIAGLGGMNHFLLPGVEKGVEHEAQIPGAALRYGVHAMELLVNKLLQNGADRRRLQAKLFGGARMIKGLTDIGDMNAAFAERFLTAEGISVVGGSLRGNYGRRIQFWPVSGRARQIMIGLDRDEVMQAERHQPPPQASQSGLVELF